MQDVDEPEYRVSISKQDMLCGNLVQFHVWLENYNAPLWRFEQLHSHPIDGGASNNFIRTQSLKRICLDGILPPNTSKMLNMRVANGTQLTTPYPQVELNVSCEHFDSSMAYWVCLGW